MFLGGSLIDHGGQNPIEPARLQSTIIHGIHTQNFKEVYKLLDDNKISYKAKNIFELTKLVDRSISNSKNKKSKYLKIKKLGNTILNKTINEINTSITATGWTVTDGTTSQTIVSGNALTVVGQSGINAVVSATDTLTLSLENIARRTPGFTGADLANLLNEAAILTARRRKYFITITCYIGSRRTAYF